MYNIKIIDKFIYCKKKTKKQYCGMGFNSKKKKYLLKVYKDANK